MPIEIKEMSVKMEINESSTPSKACDDDAKGGMSTDEQSKLVQECVQEVLSILKDKLDR